MKNLIKLALASTLAFLALTSVSYAGHHGKKHHAKKHHVKKHHGKKHHAKKEHHAKEGQPSVLVPSN